MPSVATTSRRMETFARALDRAVASKIVPRARIDQLRSAFTATDAQGRSWTIDPEFQRWGRLDGELWMYDGPPPQLFMDSELRASLEALEAPVSEDAATPASAAMAAPDAAPAPDRIPVSAESPASVPPRDASHDHERWVPTSIAPRLAVVHPEARDDRAHVFLCGLLATLFLALAVWKGDRRGYAAALLFALLAVTLLALNLARSRHD